MRIEQLQYFAEVVRTGSITAAAKNFFVSQQGISEAIKNLENEVEFPLLTRKNRKVSLTTNGEIFYEKTITFLQAYDDVLTCATELKRSYLRSNNKIILTINPIFFKLFTQNIFPIDPAIALSIYEVSIGDAILSLQKKRVQLSIILVRNNDIISFKQTLPEELEAIPLFEDKLVAVVGERSDYADCSAIIGEDPTNLYVEFVSSYYSWFNMNRSNITSIMTNDLETQKNLILHANAIGVSTEKFFPFLYGDNPSIQKKPFTYNAPCTFFLMQNKTLYNQNIERTIHFVNDVIDRVFTEK